MVDAKQEDIVAVALVATRENRSIEFKERCNPDAPGEWIELLKDLVAISNSGGGVILVGISDDGSTSGWDAQELLGVDQADLVNVSSRYLGEAFDAFELIEVNKSGVAIVAIVIDRRYEAPIVFERPGTYDIGGGKQRTAFSKGTVYFRHGPKSEPANSKDIRRFVDREVAVQRTEWKRNIRKVITAPKNARVIVHPVGDDADRFSGGFRISEDPDAPSVSGADPDMTHPYRRMDVVTELVKRLPGVRITAHDIHCVRKVHDIETHPHVFSAPMKVAATRQS